MVLFGLLAMALTIRDLWGAWSSRSWPAVEGKIMRAKVQRFLPSSGRRGNSWDWGIRYEYTVNSVRYEGQLAYYGGGPTLRVARNIVIKFPAGAKAKVYYHPDHPGISVLIPGFNRFTYGGPIVTVLFFSLAAGLWQYI